MTDGQKITAITAAMKQESQTLFSMGRRDASSAINDYLNECTSESLVRLYDLITETAKLRAA